MNAILLRATSDLLRRSLAPIVPLALGCMLWAWAQSVQATSPPTGTAPVSPPAGGFAIDGNLLANTPTNGIGDWVTNAGGGGFVLRTNGTALDTNNTIHIVDLYDDNADNIFSGGMKVNDNPNAWTWTTSKPPAKNDINHGLLHITHDANGHIWAIASGDRFSENGDSYIDFEFLQNTLTVNTNGTFSSPGPNCGRTTNDFLMTVAFTGGGSTAEFFIQRWQLSTNQPCGFDYLDAACPTNLVFAAANAGVVPVPYGAFGGTTYAANLFAEAAVDLTAVVSGFDPCLSIGVKTILIKTKTSQSSSAAIKDFVTPVQVTLRLGPIADAGPDLTKCTEGPTTSFSVNGFVQAGTAPPSSTNWSIISGPVSISSSNSLSITAVLTGATATATLRLSVMDLVGCLKTDDVILTVKPLPTCSISGPPLVCPSSGQTYDGPAGMASYSWSISGSGAISGSSNGPSVSVVAGSACDSSCALTLTVVDTNGCSSTCNQNIAVKDITPPSILCPAAITLQCASAVPAPDITSVTATDTCSTVLVTHVGDVLTASNCVNKFSLLRTYRATDACGNTNDCAQTITVNDDTPPVISAAGANATIECPATPVFTPPTATDNCMPPPIVVETGDVTTPGCAGSYSRTKTWRAVDGCGNMSSPVSQTVSVVDNTAPAISALPGPTTIECPATPSFATPTATDACGATPALTFVDITTPGSCPQEYSVTRTWTATDPCGNSSTASQTITVEDNTAPVISALPGPTTIECPATPSFAKPTATDACGGMATLTFVDVTTPGSCPQEYSVTRTWTATDPCGNSSTASQTITVEDNTAPVISALPGPTTIECPATPSFATPTATDACGGTATLTFVDVTTPGSCPQEYSVTRTWTATDPCGNTSTASQTITVEDNTAPVISALPGPTTIECPATPSFATPTATDACGGTASLTFVDVTTPGSCPQKYSVTRTWTATDPCGNSSTASQTIIVEDSTAPVISALPGPTTIECPATPSFATPTATDACGGIAALTFADVTTPGTCPQKYSITRTWTATDPCGNGSTASQTITVEDNTAPVISSLPGPTTIECPATPSFATPTATDACGGMATLTFVDVTTPGSCPQEYSVTRTWTATDPCGNSSTASQTITVEDNTAPVISALPGPTTIECPATPSFATPTASDACGGTATLTFVDVTTPGSCPQEYSVTRTWTAKDPCGNTSTASQTITVEDNTAPVISALPGPTTIECPATPSFATPTATDACGGMATLTFADVTTPGSCPQEYSVTRTWTATDPCGNSSTANQTIIVEDNTAPVISALPGPTTIECPATPSFATPTATDACGGTATLTFADVTTPGSCPQKYSVTRTWTATDPCGNSSTASQTIIVEDSTAPVISALPGPTTIECPATPSFATPTATDACGGIAALTFADVTTPGTCPQKYSITRSWTATDPCGNSSTASQIITVEDNTAPVISSLPGPTTIECPATPSFATPTAMDACGGMATLTFVDVTTPGSCPQEYSVTRTWTATDPCGNSSTASQTITVEDNTAPVISALPGSTTIECPASPSFATPTATDACGGTATLTFVDVTTPGSCPQEYSVTRTWTATDPCGNSSTASQTITVEDNTAPVISALPGPTTIECPATPSFATPTATDACGGTATLTFADVTTPGPCPQEYSVTRTWTAIDPCGNASTASQTITVEDNTAPVISSLPGPSIIQCPATPSFATPTATDACGGTATLTFADVTTPSACPQRYSITRTWTATDPCGNKSTASQTITVEDNSAPVISSLPGPTTIECPATPSFTTPTATDGCGGAATLTFVDVTTPGTCPQKYSVTRTWTAVDPCGNTNTASQTITVEDTTAPVISSLPGHTTIECPATPSFATPTATDACGGTATLTFADVTTPGSCPQKYSVTRTWTAKDPCGNTSTASQTITVEDTKAPVISALPGPTTIECPATPSFATPTATDACGPATLTFADVTTPGSCPQEYSVTRTWTATDACGNSSTASQTITVEDNTAPVISALPGPTTIECPATPSFATPTATDACGGNATLTFADVTTPGSCPQEYSVTRTWTATDPCGNKSTASQTITVEDNTAPVISSLPGPTTIECPATPSFATPTATDACGGIATLTFADVTTPGPCLQKYSVTRTWTATDPCGNKSTATQTITVEDNTAPVISSLPGPTTIECPATPSFATPTATDACGGMATLTFADVTTPGSCPQEYSVTRTWTATDPCGNKSTASQTIIVEDNTAPVITALPGPTTIECPATPSFATPTATDACGGLVTLTFIDVTTPGTCPQKYSRTRTWTATDPCGNKSTASQSITVEDNTPPVISSLPGPTTIECPAALSFATPTATDACGGLVTLTFVDVTTPGTCPQRYSRTRTWTATDPCGNSSTASQTIAVEDKAGPLISALPGPTTIECPATPSFKTPTATDACGGTVTLTFVDVTTPGSCPGEYSVMRTWTATDQCGNANSASQIINVDDVTPPTLVGVPADAAVPCGGPIPDPCDAIGVKATDDCDPNPTLTCQQHISAHVQDQAYYVTNCWTATDACGNHVEQCQVITMQACGADLCVLKFYDRNADGIQNFGEPGIAGWKFTVTGPNGYALSGFTDANGNYCFVNLPGGTYTVTEAMPKESSWSSTTPTTVQVTMQGTSKTLKFGNLCIGAGGADGTPGFWQNRNGENQMNDAPNGCEPELLMLRTMCLRTATGADFDPTCYSGCSKSFKEWLKGAKAVNMAYQLSAHLACAALNVDSGIQDPNSLIYVPGAACANAQGYALLSAVINEANQLLSQYGFIPSGHPYRDYAAMLKDALAGVNNNTGVVQPSPCPHTFAP